jgi:hypothetical protein
VTDPYEHGFEVAQRRRLHLPLDPPPESRKRWQRPGRLGWQVLVVALGVVVLLAVGRAITARNATRLKPSCSQLQLAVAETSVVSRGAGLLHWAVTGPAGMTFQVAIEPPGGRSHAQISPAQVMPAQCLARGQFGVLVPAGRYTVVYIRRHGQVDERVGARPVTVTNR